MRAAALPVSALLAISACAPAVSESMSPARVVVMPNPPKTAEPPVSRSTVPGLQWVAVTSSLEMERTEATVGQYRACVEAGACSSEKLNGIDWPGRVEFEPRSNCTWPQHDDTLPVNCVSYADALAFCTFAGGRLPSADEWLTAASNGRTTTWPWGNRPVEPNCDVAVMGLEQPSCAADNPLPVCSRNGGDSRSGICDLVGNLYEWTARPTEPGQKWVMVGDCFNNFAPSLSLRETMLEIDDERYRTPPLGIRCVRDR